MMQHLSDMWDEDELEDDYNQGGVSRQRRYVVTSESDPYEDAPRECVWCASPATSGWVELDDGTVCCPMCKAPIVDNPARDDLSIINLSAYCTNCSEGVFEYPKEVCNSCTFESPMLWHDFEGDGMAMRLSTGGLMAVADRPTRFSSMLLSFLFYANEKSSVLSFPVLLEMCTTCREPLSLCYCQEPTLVEDFLYEVGMEKYKQVVEESNGGTVAISLGQAWTHVFWPDIESEKSKGCRGCVHHMSNTCPLLYEEAVQRKEVEKSLGDEVSYLTFADRLDGCKFKMTNQDLDEIQVGLSQHDVHIRDFSAVISDHMLIEQLGLCFDVK